MAMNVYNNPRLNENIEKQILSVREIGKTNMLDTKEVQRIANEMEFYELVIFIEDHKAELAHFIMTGEWE